MATLPVAEGSWLTPGILNTVVQYAEDLYIAGFVAEVVDLSTRYEKIVSSLPRVSNPRLKAEILQLQALRIRAESGLDYFGHPPGWVPIQELGSQLSFYQERIDQAIETLYFSYWLRSKIETSQQTAADMQHLANEAAENARRRNNELESVQRLLAEWQTIQTEVGNSIEIVQQEIRDVDARIAKDAANNLRPKDDGVRSFLKTAATIATLVPVGQPALGAAGVALNSVAAANPNDPVESFLAVRSSIQGLDPNTLVAIGNDVQQQFNGLDLTSANDVGTYIENARDKYASLNDTLVKIRSSLEGAQVPRSALEAEIARLRAADPAFARLAGLLTDLNAKKSEFAKRAADGAARVASLVSGVDSDLRAINDFNRSKSEAAAMIDNQLHQYLAAIGRAAQQDLLEIHDLLARAYEYNALKPYPSRFDLNRLFDRALAVAKGGKTNSLTTEDFNKLREIYNGELDRVISSLWKDVNSKLPETVQNITLALEPADLRKLNDDGSITFNPLSRFILLPRREAYRIADISISRFNFDRDKVDGRATANMIISFAPSERGSIKSGDNVYAFTYPTGEMWGFTFDLTQCPQNPDGSAACGERDSMSPKAINLVSGLLERGNAPASVRPSLERFYPPAITDVTIRKALVPPHLPQPDITALKLSFKLEASQPSSAEKILVVESENGFAPTISINLLLPPKDRTDHPG